MPRQGQREGRSARGPIEPAARLQALVRLTELADDRGSDKADDGSPQGGDAASAVESGIAGSVIDRLLEAVGASAGLLLGLDGGHWQLVAERRVARALLDVVRSGAVDDSGAVERFAAAAGHVMEAIGPSGPSDGGPDDAPEGPGDTLVSSARDSGMVAWAALPIRDDGRLTDLVLILFDRSPAEIPVDHQTLDAVGRLVSLTFANRRLRLGIRASEERYRTLFEASPEAYLVLGRDGTIQGANAAAAGLFEIDPGDLLGRHAEELGVGDPREIATVADELRHRRRAIVQGVAIRGDDSRFPAEANVTEVAIGGERRLLMRVRDLTDQERHEQDLAQAQKMEAIGMLVSGVAHELNNPLAAIIGYSTLLGRDERLPDDMRHDASVLLQEADRTRRIVQNLLDFARQRPPERHPTDLHPLVQSILELQSYLIGTNRIEVRLDLPEDLPAVDVDRAQMQQVLLNLTVNAVQAIRSSADSGWLEVAATAGRTPDGRAALRLRITDSGPGIPEASRSRLFVPFFTTKPPGEGTGLGLSVSFGIVAAHGGRLWHEPAPDGGASFVLELPLDGLPVGAGGLPSPPTGRESDPSPAPRRLQGVPEDGEPVGGGAMVAGGPGVPPGTAGSIGRPRVLVLDDEPSILTFLAKALQHAGYEAIPAGTGAGALEIVRERSPDAVLCDYRMSGMSGTDFYDAIVEIRPGLAHRFVFMSGDVLNPELRSFAIDHEIALLAKPFDLEAVGRTVGDVLRTPGAG